MRLGMYTMHTQTLLQDNGNCVSNPQQQYWTYHQTANAWQWTSSMQSGWPCIQPAGMDMGACLWPPRWNSLGNIWQGPLEQCYGQISKQHWEHIQTQPNSTVLKFGGKPWRLWLGLCKQSLNTKTQLLDHTCGLAAQKHWSKKQGFLHTDLSSIDWDSIDTATVPMTISQNFWSSKFVMRFSATRKMMQQIGQWKSAACPWCREDSETTVHILQCPWPSSQLWWRLDIQSLWALLKDLETNPASLDDISMDINAWWLQESPQLMSTLAGQQQTILSWDNFTQGFFHQESWCMLWLHHDDTESNKSSHHWIPKLQQWILKIARGQWDQPPK